MSRMAVVGLVATILVGACSPAGKDGGFSVREESVGLTFAADKAGQTEPAAVEASLSSEPLDVFTGAPVAALAIPSTPTSESTSSSPPPQSPAFSQPPRCPALGEGQGPEEPASSTPRKAPDNGLYSLSGPVRQESAPPPRVSEFEVTAGPYRVSDAKSQPVTTQAGQSGLRVTFVTNDQSIPGLQITTHWSSDPGGLTIVRRDYKSSDGLNYSISPVPAPRLMMNGSTDGSTWFDVGVDSATGGQMFLTGRIVRRDRIDICGRRLEAWVVSVTETVYDPRTGFTIDTADQSAAKGAGGDGKPNTYWITPNLGSLLVKQDRHEVYARTASDGTTHRTYLTATQTFDSLAPVLDGHG